MDDNGELDQFMKDLAPPSGGGSVKNAVIASAARKLLEVFKQLKSQLAASQQEVQKLRAEVDNLKTKQTVANPAIASYAKAVKPGNTQAATTEQSLREQQPVRAAKRAGKLGGAQPDPALPVRPAPPVVALRFQPIPGSGNVLPSSRQAAVEQLDDVLWQAEIDPPPCIQVYPPKAQGTEQASTQLKQGVGMVFTMLPVEASRLFKQFKRRLPEHDCTCAELLRRNGWSIRLHLPVEQYKCKCALYNLHKTQLQGKQFHFEQQYTKLVVENGPTYQLPAEVQKAICAH